MKWHEHLDQAKNEGAKMGFEAGKTQGYQDGQSNKTLFVFAAAAASAALCKFAEGAWETEPVKRMRHDFSEATSKTFSWIKSQF